MPTRTKGVGLRAAVLSAVAVLVMLLGGTVAPALADTGDGSGAGSGTTQNLAPSADGTCTNNPCEQPPMPTFPPSDLPSGPTYVSPVYPYATPATCQEPGHLTVPPQPAGVHETHSGSGTGTITFVFTHDAGYAFPEGTDQVTYVVHVEPRLSGTVCHGPGPIYGGGGGGFPTHVSIPPIPAPPPLRWTIPAMPPAPRWAVQYHPGRVSYNFAAPMYGGHHAGMLTRPTHQGTGIGHVTGEHAGTTAPSAPGTEACTSCTTSTGQVPTNVEAGSTADRGQQAPLQIRTALLLTGVGGTFVLGVLALGLWRHRAARARG